MDKLNKKQLFDIIKKQEEDLARYKKSFQDVVAAHKRLRKEKEALEVSIRVMSQSTTQPEIIVSSDLESSTFDDNASTTSSTSKTEDFLLDDRGTSNESVEHLKTQLATLMQSLATLSAEKSCMEATFLADKKTLRAEKEEQEKVIKELKKKLEQLAQTHQTELENYKTKLIIERHQREKEHHDHGVMIRELQKLVAEERTGKEKASRATDEAKRELVASQAVADQREKEVESLRRKLNREQDGSGPLLSSLQHEMTAMKEQHTVAIQREQERASEAEKRTKKLAAMHEERVANLEARLAELSQTVGTYDRLRQEDQCSIDKLKERLIQLEIEHDEDREKEKGDVELDVLVDRLKHIKTLIDAANQSAEKPIDIQVALYGDSETNNLNRYSSSDHSLCNEEYRLLKEEFETYKRNSNQHSISYSPNKEDSMEMEKSKVQVKNLKEKIRILQSQLEDTEKYYKEKIDESQRVLKVDRERWQSKLSIVEQDHRSHLSDLETQVARQRERALALVRDKDEEIALLKASFHSLLPSPVSRLSQSSDKDAPIDAVSAYNRDTSNTNDVFDVSESRPMLHYVQELSRMQIDVAKLRKQRHRLETALRDAQLSSAEERESLLAQINNLSEDVARLERCQTREGANLEYLKNVVLSYLLTSDDRSKSHMLNAIAAVLQFSDSEKIRVTHTAGHKATSIP